MFLLLVLMYSLLCFVACIEAPSGEVRVNYQSYKYSSPGEKLKESLSIGNCKAGPDSDISLRVVAPNKEIIGIWGRPGKEKLNQKIYFRTTHAMCSDKDFMKIKSGRYKVLGCMITIGSNKGKPVQIPPAAATLHPFHTRCNNLYAAQACSAGSLSPATVRDEDRRLHNFPFIITANNVVVAKSGFLALPCGVFGLFASCEAVKWGVPAAQAVVSSVEECRSSGGHCPFRKYDKVFVMTQYDDTQIGQFILEALPKLVYHLDYIRSNPDVKIHYGFSKLAVLPDFVLPNLYLRWLGLEHRLVNGTIYANEVMMPREGGCQDVSYNAWEALTMRQRFIQMTDLDPRSAAIPKIPRLLVLTRTAGKFMQNQYDHKVRSWPKGKFVPDLLSALKVAFPELSVELFSDADEALMTCQPCQIRLFSTARVVIGHHGAGLTNTLYMPQGGIVVEVSTFIDSRNVPGIGIFPTVANVVGLNHFSYYTFNETHSILDPARLTADTATFARSVAHWT